MPGFGEQQTNLMDNYRVSRIVPNGQNVNMIGFVHSKEALADQAYLQILIRYHHHLTMNQVLP